MTQNELPTTSCAFDDPVTRSSLQEAWRRALIRFAVWVAVWVLLLVVVGVTRDSGMETVQTVAVILALIGLRPLGLSALSLRCLQGIEAVLRIRPWQFHGPVRRVPRVRGRGGVPVQIRIGEGEDGWAPVMVARAPFRSRRWMGEMENGAWFAGDLDRGGVLALPGGRGLMAVRTM
ncbi:hypothetical protein [Streptomyces bluensis]|uniref:Integral membrane protein n=1 Tax=Streptomyces bluensis TaxID=33897 RepID=A0ABW6UQ69_9ACTN